MLTLFIRYPDIEVACPQSLDNFAGFFWGALQSNDFVFALERQRTYRNRVFAEFQTLFVFERHFFLSKH
jgi:pyruvate/2-oxoglutarate/acetoin dehydrogenase E1 component